MEAYISATGKQETYHRLKRDLKPNSIPNKILFMKSNKDILLVLIRRASEFGLSEQDSNNAIKYLNYDEYGLCLELIVTQLYEFEIQIGRQFYFEIDSAAKRLQFPKESYTFLQELISIAD